MILRLGILALSVMSVAAWPIAGSPAADGQTVTANAAGMKFVNFPGLPACATGAVENGDPNHGPSVILLKATAGCKIPWHWHTPNEQVMIASGVGMVEMKDAKPVSLRAGGYASFPSRHAHQFSCVGPCMAFVSSDGIFDIHYVDKDGKEISPEQALGSGKM